MRWLKYAGFVYAGRLQDYQGKKSMKVWNITLKINNSRKCILNIIFTASGCEKVVFMYLSSGLHVDTWAWALSMDLWNLIHPLLQPLPCFNYRNHQCDTKCGVTRCCITQWETFLILSVNAILTYARNPSKTSPNQLQPYLQYLEHFTINFYQII